jgi:hypothetical protein
MKQPDKQQPEKTLPVSPGIVQPLIDELTKPRDPQPPPPAPPQGPVHPPQPAELDQDPGGGYNPDHTIPQP